MSWVIGVIVIIVIGFLLDREIYFYEGAHLSPRVQSWLYDRWSQKYDAGKRESQLHDNEMLAEPLLGRLADVEEPFVLDFATGTGRLSHALLTRPEFKGRIIAVDLSQGMLEQAAAKLSGSSERVDFLRHQSLPLPFPDETFDTVYCLEVLELLPHTQAALNEMSRLLRPGGVLLTSRGTEESGRRAKVKSDAQLTSMLSASGFENVQVTKWWKLFDRVLARKRGTSSPASSRVLTDVLKCSSCGKIQWTAGSGALECSSCKHRLQVTGQGIVLN